MFLSKCDAHLGFFTVMRLSWPRLIFQLVFLCIYDLFLYVWILFLNGYGFGTSSLSHGSYFKVDPFLPTVPYMNAVSLLAAEMRHNDKVMCIMHDRELRHRKQLCRAINDFQQRFQKPETRREFDLSDPLALKKELPARVSDNDMRNTISGMQKFMGEDLNFQERKRIQKEQNREWSLQQHGEWERAQAEHKLAGKGREDEVSTGVLTASHRLTQF